MKKNEYYEKCNELLNEMIRCLRPVYHRPITLKNRTPLSDEKDKAEEKSHLKQAVNMNGSPDWLINSIPSIQHALESTTSVLSDDTSDDGQEFGRDITTKKPTSKKSPVYGLILKECDNRSGQCSNNMTSSRLILSL